MAGWRAAAAAAAAPGGRGLGLKLPPQRADTGPQYVQPAGYEDDEYYESSDGGTTPAREENPEQPQQQQQGWGQLRGGKLAALRDNSAAQRTGSAGGAGGVGGAGSPGPFSRGLNRHQMQSLSGLRQPSDSIVAASGGSFMGYLDAPGGAGRDSPHGGAGGHRRQSPVMALQGFEPNTGGARHSMELSQLSSARRERAGSVTPKQASVMRRAAGRAGRVMVGRCWLKPFVSPVESPWCQRLKLTCDILLSSFAFNFNLRHYGMGALGMMGGGDGPGEGDSDGGGSDGGGSDIISSRDGRRGGGFVEPAGGRPTRRMDEVDAQTPAGARTPGGGRQADFTWVGRCEVQVSQTCVDIKQHLISFC